MSGGSQDANNLGAFPPMSTAGRTDGLWPGAYAPIPTNKRFCKCAMEKDAVAKYFFYDAPEGPDQLVNSWYGLEPETIA